MNDQRNNVSQSMTCGALASECPEEPVQRQAARSRQNTALRSKTREGPAMRPTFQFLKGTSFCPRRASLMVHI
ncbi:hypothetical protein LEMLEM_LOCUS24284 [Lemmus lemmus]